MSDQDDRALLEQAFVEAAKAWCEHVLQRVRSSLPEEHMPMMHAYMALRPRLPRHPLAFHVHVEPLPWPLGAWQDFLLARSRAIASMLRAGHTPAEVCETLNLSDENHVLAIAEGVALLDKPGGGE